MERCRHACSHWQYAALLLSSAPHSAPAARGQAGSAGGEGRRPRRAGPPARSGSRALARGRRVRRRLARRPRLRTGARAARGALSAFLRTLPERPSAATIALVRLCQGRPPAAARGAGRRRAVTFRLTARRAAMASDPPGGYRPAPIGVRSGTEDASQPAAVASEVRLHTARAPPCADRSLSCVPSVPS